ncbi:helix-turn-helix transcriptional regulator [Amycolatopsis sp. CFH S0078]|uniref:helix-turn-helix transcriptional regulator n=1 Tax=Amycolatopsis sp. CFH S0078 TaxID=1644108 RepID=UPI0014319611|nr:helix-turn-helix transcriptional regulator [Amycolatopsis sp. CFH S0078]
MRLTHAAVGLAAAFMEAPDEPHWGYSLSRQSGVGSASMYRRLSKWLEDGWLTDGWEDPEEAKGRAPRRYYQLTDRGCLALGAILARAQEDKRFNAAAWRLA